MKTIFIYFFLVMNTNAKTFEDVGLKEGTYTWLRLNSPGGENTACLMNDKLPRLTTNDLKGSFEIKGDRIISKRSYKACDVIEHIKLVSTSAKVVVLQLENVELNGCEDINEVRSINIERPYDDENLSFLSTPFKILEIKNVEGVITFKRKNTQCFYAVKQ